MVRVAWLFVIGGCNQIYGLEPTRVGGNDAHVCDRGASFPPGIEVTVAPEFNIEAARFTASRAIAYLSLCPASLPNISECEIYTAPYSVGDQRFGGVSKMTGVSLPAIYDSYPTIAGDEQHLLFASTRGSTPTTPHLFVAQTVGGSFDNPVITQLLPDPANEPFIVGHGRVLYFSRKLANGVKLTRMEGDPPTFGGAPLEVAGADLGAVEYHAPVPSEDELELFFGAGKPVAALDIYHASRASTAEPFGTPTKLASLSTSDIDYPVSLSPSGCELYYINKAGDVTTLFVATR